MLNGKTLSIVLNNQPIV